MVDLLLADKASAVEFPPINDLFKILRFESVAVLNFAYKKHKHICTNKIIEYKKYVNIVLQCLLFLHYKFAYIFTCFLAMPRGGFTVVSTYANCVFLTGVDAAWFAFMFCRSLANFSSRSSRHR